LTFREIYKNIVCELLAPTHCFYNNNKYLNGDTWKPNKCTSCDCRDGLAFCHTKVCNIIENCSAMVVINDECCPTCQGIRYFVDSIFLMNISLDVKSIDMKVCTFIMKVWKLGCISSNGSFYSNSQNWYEDDCTHCECNNGKISCRVEMCQPVSCDRPVILPGHCCPTCQTHACNLHCPQGYRKDSLGNDICECNNCLNKQQDCVLLCRFGFKRGEDGCEICECETAPYDLNANIEDTKIDDKVCTLSNGTIFENGHYWHDGCGECLCNSGKVMCTKPECPTIKCLNSIIIDGQCCPTCSGGEFANSSKFSCSCSKIISSYDIQ